MTPSEKAEAIAVLDANIPASQTVDPETGYYVQVKRFSPDGIHTIWLDQYHDVAYVAGYRRYCTVADTAIDDLIHTYTVVYGPQAAGGVWSQLLVPPAPP